MRLVGWLLFLLMVLGWLAAELPLDGTSAGGQRKEVSLAGHSSGVDCQDDWRRTRDGWERRSWWTPKSPVRRPALHPLLVVLLEIFLALAALISFSAAKEQRPHAKPAPAHSPEFRRSSQSGPYRFVELRRGSRP